MAYNFTAIEKKWQKHWLENKSFRALDPQEAAGMPKKFVLDMFPYPSGAGLHVGHPEGYTATDIYSRYLRMKGYNVLHPMGWDAFGLPAEQYAIKTGQHPRLTTEENIANFRRQIQMLGLSYDWDREVDTTDPEYYKWTQWIFLQLFDSYFDPVDKKAKSIRHLMLELVNENYVVAPDGSIRLRPVNEGMEPLAGEVRAERLWRELSEEEQTDIIDGLRLAYQDEIPVNWCAGLGTVLANEEVIDGKSEVGGFPVERRPMRQWMLRITAYADRLLDDLSLLDWPESLKEMQRNWIGRSIGAEVDFEIADNAQDDAAVITVFTTRPDTLYGATYMVLAPEHPLVEKVTTADKKTEVEAYRQACAGKSERDRMAETKEKTGVFTGGHAINPVNQAKIPIYIADYVLMGYGTGAIMAVPAHDERDFAFAKKFALAIPVVVLPPAEWLDQHAPLRRPPLPENASAELRKEDYAKNCEAWPCFSGDGVAIKSPIFDGLATARAKEKITGWLEDQGVGKKSVKYKLRDWLFSRQRYWGEPFPIVLDGKGNAFPVTEEELPVMLPEMEDFKPTGTPEPPLSKAKDWVRYERDGEVYLRETNTMPQWAGSCWYYLRYMDAKNSEEIVSEEKENYWMPVDLYVGGVEHAVLHLLYARFWHKVLFDLKCVSTPEPFQKLVNQGLILGEMEYHFFEDSAGRPVSTADVRDIDEEAGEAGVKMIAFHKQSGEKLFGKRLEETLVEKQGEFYVLRADSSVRVDARSFKMSKSRGNVVNPDRIVEDFGADVFRLYEMYMGPLEASKPWATRDIVGMSRFLNSVWRNLVGEDDLASGTTRVGGAPIPDALERQVNRTIKKVGEDIEGLRFNTAIAELIKLNNEINRLEKVPQWLAESLVLMLAPFAPHIAEEIWERLDHKESLARHAWPAYDPDKLVESTMELPVQVNGKLRGKIVVAADADQAAILQAAKAVESVRNHLSGKTMVKELYVSKKLVSFVVK